MPDIDSALWLRTIFDKGQTISEKKIADSLEQSKIVRKLTNDYENNAFFNLFRLICLSEIPYSERLPYTEKVISYISEHLSFPEGFSYTKSVNNIVPCYNALLLESYTRLGKATSQEVRNALNWIKQYQVFDRDQSTAWKYDGICKHGGCMKATPCYIGIGKTVRALITYSDFTNQADKDVEVMIDKGVDYMLRHKMYQRLSNSEPISAHIIDIMFPQAYMLSVTDLVYIAGKRKLWMDSHTHALKELLNHKKYDNGGWKIDYSYSHKGYKAFDSKRKTSNWIDHVFRSCLSN